jgi:hypothetical protein
MEKNFLEDELPEENRKKMSEEEQKSFKEKIANVAVYFYKGERYRNKDESIRKWMEDDRKRDELLENATIPRRITCPKCFKPMEGFSRHLEFWSENKTDRVLFFLACKDCKEKRFIYDNGEEYESKPTLCPKCNRPEEASDKKEGNIITITYSCSSCGNSRIETMDLNKKEEKKEEIDPDFNKDRQRFCLSEEEGTKYVQNTNLMIQLGKEMKEREENKEYYAQVAKIKKLTIVEVEKLLNETLATKGYTHIELAKPEFARNVIVAFTVQDSLSGRKEYDSKNTLKSL